MKKQRNRHLREQEDQTPEAELVTTNLQTAEPAGQEAAKANP